VQICEFDYQQFFAENDVSRPVPCRTGFTECEEDSEGLFDVPPPAWFRRNRTNDPFPSCRELMRWPAGFRAEDFADLRADELAETDPGRFVYSDAEMDAWAGVVAGVLDDGPPWVVDPAPRPLPSGQRKRHATTRASGGLNMSSDFAQASNFPSSERQPPIQRFRVRSVSASVWVNTAGHGGRFHTVTLDRSFKNRDGGWSRARSFRVSDLPDAIAVLQKALMELGFKEHSSGNAVLEETKPEVRIENGPEQAGKRESGIPLPTKQG